MFQCPGLLKANLLRPADDCMLEDAGRKEKEGFTDYLWMGHRGKQAEAGASKSKPMRLRIAPYACFASRTRWQKKPYRKPEEELPGRFTAAIETKHSSAFSSIKFVSVRKASKRLKNCPKDGTKAKNGKSHSDGDGCGEKVKIGFPICPGKGAHFLRREVCTFRKF